MQRLSGKVTNGRYTALIWLFSGKTDKTDFSSDGFKLLWENEKSINTEKLKEKMQTKQYLKNSVITAV